MHRRLALLLIVIVVALAAGPLFALQRSSPPRQVAVEWLAATTVADALRHLPRATVEQFRALPKTTPEQEMVVNMVEPMLAPLVYRQLMGGTLRTTGSPVSTVTISGQHSIGITVLNVATTGDSATVPLRVRAPADATAEAGAIELRRADGTWRIVAANLGSRIPLVRFDEPNYVQLAKTQAIDELIRDRSRMADAMVIGRLRSLVSAQLTYSVYNGGFFAPPQCLSNLASCKASFNLDPPPLDAGALTLRGYTGRFHPGEKPTPAQIAAAKAVSQSLKAWAHVFTPEDAASQARPICGDSTGRVCRLPAGRVTISGGACPAECEDVK